jgi:thymidylate synthase
MRVYSAETFSEVYEKSLRDLLLNPDFKSKPRNLEIHENLGVCLEILNPVLSLYKNERRGSQLKYIAAELVWYFLGRRDADFITRYAQFWDRIKNEDGTVNSSYGYLLFGKKNRFGKCQYEWALDSLASDPDSRQAIMHFNLPEHQYSGNKDFVCTMYGIWHIRNNKLDLTIHMRSNDAILGMPTDIAFFTVLQQQMLSHLKSFHYKDLELGKYTHIVDSYHLYDTHFDLVGEMLEKDFKPDSLPTLSRSLINKIGNPSSDLIIMEENLKDYGDSSDELYNWIHKNINA